MVGRIPENIRGRVVSENFEYRDNIPTAQRFDGTVDHVPDYLVFAIIVSIFCCIFLGLPAVVFAAKANGMKESGNQPGALENAAKAKTWCWVAFGVGLVWMILIVGINLALVVATLSKM